MIATNWTKILNEIFFKLGMKYVVELILISNQILYDLANVNLPAMFDVVMNDITLCSIYTKYTKILCKFLLMNSVISEGRCFLISFFTQCSTKCFFFLNTVVFCLFLLFSAKI